ncbi:MAG TPA: signal peptide peptidase SppA [Steroidobacteraceae bacterium]|nr:signal peptide peptidase SppA [Steroidobacteraceae bacterium]
MPVLRGIWAVLKGIWRALDGLRKVLHLVLLLILFGLLFATSRSELPYVPDNAALVLEPKGYLVEELSGDPLERALSRLGGGGSSETRLRDLVDAVDQARDDDRIQALVLDLEHLEGAGLPMLQDLAQSIRWFRESGKKVYAYAESFSQRQYYLAAQADEVYLDPMGYILLEGYGYYRSYFRGTLDKLAVEVNVFKAGSHKSAPEQWTRADMSPEDRADAEVWVGALWDGYKADVGAARKLDPALVQAYADEAAAGIRGTGGDVAQYALARGLVDGLKTRTEFEALVAEVAGEDEDEEAGYSAVDWRSYLPYARSEASLKGGGEPAVGVVVASGEILDGEHAPGIVGGDSIAKLLRSAREDDDIGAVVLRIDSPGGSIMASEVIRREVAELRKAGKPVVASMGTVAASGGYYIAMDADRIIAAPTTITGSIGVFVVIPTFERTLEKFGVTNDGFGTTRLAGQTDLDRGLGPEVKEIVQASIEHAYRTFVDRVAKARKRRPEEIESLAQGRVWIGADAKAAGIVDELGNADDAIAEAARLANLEEGYDVRWLEKELDWQDALVLRLRNATAWLVGSITPRRAALPEIGFALERARALLALAAEGRPVYLCSCRVE